MKIEKILQKAENNCLEQGGRLTPKRRQVLEILLLKQQPLSAYEIAEHYQQMLGESIPAMSVYRMLDFLMTQGLVHKLSSANKFIACSHIACSHSHQTPQFLICDNCQSVSEIGIENMLINALEKSIRDNDFELKSRQLELHGLCKGCQASS
ncbi:Fur family transcriptional regulator [Methylophaga sp. OBS3]|uniref:Fur family transcriptional regulator n=1 Tax=Methylophaga sp. OBS3 TaxID=2991934 RepID=UPI00224D1870|nr:Fur family transcriptional regulator [Methylophaga sp. OBS3]MCX4190266.1 transcriptional repressor [Methylophaga sp. OBS3]